MRSSSQPLPTAVHLNDVVCPLYRAVSPPRLPSDFELIAVIVNSAISSLSSLSRRASSNRVAVEAIAVVRAVKGDERARIKARLGALI